MRNVVMLVASVVGACGGAYDVAPEVPDDECWNLTCPLALGSEVVADAVFNSDVTERIPIERASVTPRELLELAWAKSRLVIHPRVAGSGTLTIDVDDATFETPVRVEPVASTAVVPLGLREDLPAGAVVDGRFAMFADSTVRVVAEHRAASGERLLGSGLEAWAITGGTLATPDEVPVPALVRDVQAAGVEVVVTAGGGPPLAIDVVAPGTTAAVELYYPYERARVPPGSLVMTAGHAAYARVLPFTADGRWIAGRRPLTATVADPAVASVEALEATGYVRFEAHAAGATEVTLTFDGRSARYALDVR